MLKVENISRQFAQKHHTVSALEKISLEIAEGEFISITGPSGSGKSTLLLALGGMSSPDEGNIFWRGESIYDWEIKKRAEWRALTVGFVFQTFNLIPYLNVFDNISLSQDLSLNHRANHEDIIKILNRINLSDRIDHLPAELSVGQQQRVALARALIKNPQLILADEPTGNLDPVTASEIINILQEVHQEGKTVILVTHDPELSRLADREIKLVDGKIVG